MTINLERKMGQNQDNMSKNVKKLENGKKLEKTLEQEKDFKPREYQVEILDKCLQENTIVYMPTGSGKTFIASMLIKCFGKEVENKYTDGGRRIFFLVNTVALVNQQANAIKAHLPYSIGRLSGDMGVDHWDKAIWNREFDKNQVFVMTAQIFLNLLLHHFIKFENVALLIMDECHHATGNHAMSQIMREYRAIYENDFPHKQTRVLGLTATLLNANCKANNVDAQIKQLETVLCSKIVTSVNREMVQKFSTNPIEKLIYFNNDPNRSILWKTLLKKKFDQMEEILASLQFEDDPVLVSSAELGTELTGTGPWKKRLRTMLEIVIETLETMGLYAASKAMLVIIVRIERLLLSRIDTNLIFALKAINTELHFLRKLMSRELGQVDPKDQPLTHCTDKLRKLFEAIKMLKETDHSIVFVQQRVTAKVLFYIFEDLQKLNEDFKNIKPDFIVGFNTNPMNDTRELLFERKKNHETLEKFRMNKTNILFSSEVIEEGIDIPLCNLVVKFDFPKTYRSYVQSKGRARHRQSHYIIFVDGSDIKFQRIYPAYQSIEQSMFERLGFCDEFDENDDQTEYIEPYQPFGPTGPKITALSAISLVNRYCSLLPQDKFSSLTASWWSKPVYVSPNEMRRVVSVRLPINSCISEIVQSDPFLSTVDAKRSAALKVCILLHERGELNDSLLPVGSEATLLEDETLFPWWNHNEGDNEKSAGTRKLKRNYKKIFPSWLSECRPEPNITLFVHVLEVAPDYPCPQQSRDKAFYHLLNSPSQFSILSTKELPEICSYQLYLSVGKVNVKVKVNAAKLVLTKEQIDQLFEFHCLLFTSVIPLVQLFMVKDFENDENSFFVVPTRDGDIDWDVINNHKSIPPVSSVLPENRRNMTFKTSDYDLKIVVPWYRTEGYTTRYVVTRVCENQTPNSPFPSENFQSYKHYFKQRYNITVENENQPLLEVRAISSRLNCLLPRSKHKSKRRQIEEQDFEEYLIPEFCILVNFPSIYMVKATLLPSVIHRLHHLLLAEELRQKIAIEVGLGPKKSQNWLPLTIDEYAVKQEGSSQQSTIEVSNQLASSMKSLLKDDYPWELEEEPQDVERHLSELDLISLIRFQKFVHTPLQNPIISSPPAHFSYSHKSRETYFSEVCEDSNSLKNLATKRNAENMKQKAIDCILSMDFDETKGPELCDVLQSLTAKTACDIVNYERLETLGDSFLKFITSLALFTYYKLDEGKLSQVKGKIVGNRNLFYSGHSINLGSYMKIYDFSPNDWDIPCFSAEKVLKHLLREKNISPAVFHDIVLTNEEKKLGVYSNETLEYINNLLETKCEDVDAPASSNLSLIGMQLIGDKVIADCIEALIGLYLKSCGIIGALKLCNWLGIIVPEVSAIDKLFSPPVEDADYNLNFLNEPNKIEETLNYKFKNRGYLLQALTHSSFITGVSECYQRLEFLGDAIIDFLITVHIYENCGNLSPGELTDLRSALVNNVTFACLVVRYGLHVHMNFHACRLSEMINRFVVHQKNRNHEIGAEVLFLVEEDDVQISEIVDIPKVLGDIFESLIGAVYLDSGKCLKTTWKVIHHLMKNEIESFSKNVPKNHIRVLYEKFPNPPPKFGKSVLVQEGQMQVIIPLHVVHNREAKIFHGVGKNKSQAKLASAKLALRYYSSKSLQT